MVDFNDNETLVTQLGYYADEYFYRYDSMGKDYFLQQTFRNVTRQKYDQIITCMTHYESASIYLTTVHPLTSEFWRSLEIKNHVILTIVFQNQFFKLIKPLSDVIMFLINFYKSVYLNDVEAVEKILQYIQMNEDVSDELAKKLVVSILTPPEQRVSDNLTLELNFLPSDEHNKQENYSLLSRIRGGVRKDKLYYAHSGVVDYSDELPFVLNIRSVTNELDQVRGERDYLHHVARTEYQDFINFLNANPHLHASSTGSGIRHFITGNKPRVYKYSHHSILSTSARLHSLTNNSLFLHHSKNLFK